MLLTAISAYQKCNIFVHILILNQLLQLANECLVDKSCYCSNVRRIVLIGGSLCTVITDNYQPIRPQLLGLTSQIRYYPRNRDRGLNSANLLSDSLKLPLSFLLELSFHLSFNTFFYPFTLFHTQLITMVSSSTPKPSSISRQSDDQASLPHPPPTQQPIANYLANSSIRPSHG